MNPQTELVEDLNAAHPLARFSYRTEIKGRREKFKPLTEGITNDNARRIVEVLCEQQLLHLRRAQASLNGGTPMSLDEASVSSSDIAVFNKFALRIIPRVYPNLFVKDLVSIQPMPLPEAKVFYKDFKRDSAGTRLDLSEYKDRTYGNRAAELDTVAKIKMSLTSSTVTATTKALQYEFSQEFNQDLMAYHGLTADGELSVEAAREIQQEIEMDIVYALLNSAGAGNVNWSATPPVSDTKTIDIEAYNKTFYHAVVDARKLVFKKRYVYPNWLVAGPDVCARIEKLPGFVYDPSIQPYVGGTGVTAAVAAKLLQGRQLFGTINGIIAVYVDPWFPADNKAVLGYKGTTDFDVGLVYSPYIPFYATAPLETPGTLSVTRALMARQAVSMLVPEMYSTVTITNLS